MPTRPHRRRIRLDARVYSQPYQTASLTICTRDRRPIFADDKAAALVVDTLSKTHSGKTKILGFCVMPDHVHVLALKIKSSVSELVRSFKGRTSAGLRRLGYTSVWQRSYYDHLIRREEDLAAALQYILENPIRQNLAEDWTVYPWCGSFQWPGIDHQFFAANPSDIMWKMVASQDP